MMESDLHIIAGEIKPRATSNQPASNATNGEKLDLVALGKSNSRGLT